MRALRVDANERAGRDEPVPSLAEVQRRVRHVLREEADLAQVVTLVQPSVQRRLGQLRP